MGEELKAAERRTFPILGGGGARIDWQLVADHGGQAKANHSQTVERLAERGGLSWCELYAVLHNKKWERMDDNAALIACRALEARYLAALRTDPDHLSVLREAREALAACHETLHQCTAVLSANDCATVAKVMRHACSARTHLDTLLQTKGDDRGEG